MGNILLNVKCNKWQIEQKRNPVSVDKEKESQEAVNSRFRDNVCVETIAEVDRVDIITVHQV